VEALGSGSEVPEGSCTGEFGPGATVGAGLGSLGCLGVGVDPLLGGVGLGMDMLKLPSVKNLIKLSSNSASFHRLTGALCCGRPLSSSGS
jgi:hypothetical protein